MYPEVAPRMIPRIAKWIFRDVNMDRISDFGLRISDLGNQRESGQSPKSEIRNPKSEIVFPISSSLPSPRPLWLSQLFRRQPFPRRWLSRSCSPSERPALRPRLAAWRLRHPVRL